MSKPHPGKSTHATIRPHGDGTYTITHHRENGMYGPDGEEKTEHPEFGHAAAELARRYAQGSHMHIEDSEDGYVSHHVHDGGSVKGPHEHRSMAALKKHVQDCMEE